MGRDCNRVSSRRPDRAFLAAFALDLVEIELGLLDAPARERTTEWVVARMYGAADVARWGFVLIGTVLASMTHLITGSGYAQLPDAERHRLARWLLATRLPIVTDYVHTARALAVTFAFEPVAAAS